MMNKKILYLLLFNFIYIFQSFSQVKSTITYPDNPSDFINKLDSFFKISNRKDLDESLTILESNIRNKVYTEEDFKVILKNANKMLSLKLTAFPYYYDYFTTINAIKNSANNASKFNKWNEVAFQLLTEAEKIKKVEQIKIFYKFSYHLFDKKALIFSDLATNWYVSNSNFQLNIDNNNLVTLQFADVNLIAKRKNDSIQIIKTSGTFTPLTNEWKGNGGKAYWNRFEKMKEVYCEFETYQIDISKAIYKVENAKLKYDLLFPNRMIVGNFEDKLTNLSETEGYYPKFESLDKNLVINTLGKNLNYRGGIKITGNVLIGQGSSNNKAIFAQKKADGTDYYIFKADNFTIKKEELIIGEKVETMLFFLGDSITHPSANIKIDILKNILTVYRGDRAGDRNPFYDSYHKMNIDIEKLDWLLEKDTIILAEKKFGISSSYDKSVFESFKYFDEIDYQKFQNISTYNPLATIKKYYDEVKTKRVNATSLAQRMDINMNEKSIQTLLYDLVRQGFINYYPDSSIVELKDKIFHFANAYQKKVDYDYMRIVSDTKETNGTYDLKNDNMKIEGVTNVELSKKHKVAIKPWKNTINIKKNRNLQFNGNLFAGLGVFVGRNFKYDYDKFEIDLDSARYLDLYLLTDELKNGKPVAKGINSRIEYATGILLIDAPNNKSGKETLPLFPSFNTKANSYVYYDDSSIIGGCYRRDSFYFSLDKFNLNSMDAIKASDLNFKGSMYSFDIFPIYKETLLLQKDSSLGFITKTPALGYPIYKGKGNYTNQISLDRNGYLGSGVLKYLNADIKSEDFIFKPKQLLASAKDFFNKEDRSEKLSLPQVHGTDVKIDWHVYEDSMYVTTKEKSFDMYKENNHTLKGLIILTPSGVKGNGEFDWDKGIMNSKLFSFKAFGLLSDTSSLKIKTTKEKELALLTDNVNSSIDFDKQLGIFKANSDKTSTFLPYNKYMTSFNEFIWNMKDELITFKSDTNKFATFTSTEVERDSFTFQAKTGLYDLKTYELDLGGIQELRTCDAIVIPKDGKMLIRPGGEIDSLTDCTIICDTTTRYHVINNAGVKISGKKGFSAHGLYEYNLDEKKQTIDFEDVTGTRVGKGSFTEKKTETRASGTKTDEDQFFIDVKTQFKGTVKLFSTNKNLTFDGFAKLTAEKLNEKQWIYINCEADKKNLIVPYNNPKNEDGSTLETGIFISKEAAVAYPRVMMPLYFRKDRRILDCSVGRFFYNKKDDLFVFGDSAKIISNSKRGNKLIFDNKTAKISGEGSMNLVTGIKYYKVKTAGTIETKLLQEGESGYKTDSTTLVNADKVKTNFMVGLDMLVPEKLIKFVAADILGNSADATDVDYSKDKDGFYPKAIAEFVTNEVDAQKVVDDMKAKTLSIPAKYAAFNFLFSKLNMTWEPEYQSFVSNDKKLPVHQIAGLNINRNITGYVEFRMPSNEDDRIYIYLKNSAENYYFFGFQQNTLNITSNNPQFQEEVNKLKGKDKTKKFEDQTFEIQWVEPITAEAFVSRMKEIQN